MPRSTIVTPSSTSEPRTTPAPRPRVGLGLALLPTLVGCFNPDQSETVTTTDPTFDPSTTGPIDPTTSGNPTTETEGEGEGTSTTTDPGLDSSSGADAVCGNGVVEGDEECDDGPDNGNTHACTSACLQAICGDGLLWAGEEGCDDEGESATCDADCTPAACGDGTINPTAGEQCEQDGPGFDCSACTATCLEGTGDCNDDLLADGCETDLTNPATCGNCMTTCAVDEECINGGCVPPSMGMFLLTERNSPNIWQWDPITGMTSLYHSTDANDVDCNLAEGSPSAWIPWHSADYFGSFTPGAGMGLDSQYPTPYAYPKHITVYNGDIVVMSRNDATLHWYSQAGVEQGSLATGNGIGQGMATDGVQFWASFWNGANSYFVRYDAAFAFQQMIANPMGMGVNTNVVDFAYHQASGHFFGLVTNSEGGTGTQSNTVIEFDMGGSVLNTYMVPFFADGIGQSECP
ncbi:hypothetical protein [Paraliomyxa miuraensis]|uniref:hypothetical protein n=1 Tax=Paraliomyxa miuraensis TaxID=376150 RepID=UPI0022536983|nr:hypothetical protein [Paraliomyxa miuraensis]MCX4241667.1 hypothetical protein [Paraliomyxa miuraensis]